MESGAGGCGRPRGLFVPLDVHVRGSLEPRREVPVQRPSKVMVAGTTIERMIVASIKSATAMPKPSAGTSRGHLGPKPAKTAMMMRAAPVIRRAVEPTPKETASSLSPVCV